MTTTPPPLTGLVAVVTGGGGGIGGATAEVLAADGAHVVIAGRTTATLEATAERIQPIAERRRRHDLLATVRRPVGVRRRGAGVHRRGRVGEGCTSPSTSSAAGLPGGMGPVLSLSPDGLEQTLRQNMVERVQPDQARRPGDGARWRRVDRGGVLDAGHRGRATPRVLLRGEGRPRDAVQGRRRRARCPGRARQPGAPGAHPQRQRDPPQHGPRRHRGLHRAATDRNARARRSTSPTRSATSPAPSRRGPPAPRCPSTAATPCGASPTSPSTGTAPAPDPRRGPDRRRSPWSGPSPRSWLAVVRATVSAFERSATSERHSLMPIRGNARQVLSVAALLSESDMFREGDVGARSPLGRRRRPRPCRRGRSTTAR